MRDNYDAQSEITPAMIAAGQIELAQYRYDKSNEEEVVRATFKAMAEAANPTLIPAVPRAS